ncbi:MAG: hypothetical protein Q8O95_00770 [bacterium]|nr:hypothetical protein [bacterium]
MEIALSWDLVVTIFFVMVMSYSYIVGLNGTVKIILSTYIAMLAANGIGNLAAKYIKLSEPLIKILSDDPNENVVVFKIFIFVVITLLLVLRGGFSVDITRHNDSLLTRFVTNSVFGFLSAGLIMSIILVFLVGAGVDASTTVIQEALGLPDKTFFVRFLVRFYNFWFAAPAVAFVILSVIAPRYTPVIEE